MWQNLTRALKSLQNFILMCSFWAKYILFELKKNRGVILHETEEGYKIWEGINLSFQNLHKKYEKFWPEHAKKVSKIFILMGSLWAKYVLFQLKSIEELSFMKRKRDTKFGEESTCFKIGIRNLTNFNLSTQKSQRFSL